MVDEEKFYELRYKFDNYTCVVKFSAMIDGEELRDNLKDFLSGCSWSDDCIKQIFNEIDEDCEDEEDL